MGTRSKKQRRERARQGAALPTPPSDVKGPKKSVERTAPRPNNWDMVMLPSKPVTQALPSLTSKALESFQAPLKEYVLEKEGSISRPTLGYDSDIRDSEAEEESVSNTA